MYMCGCLLLGPTVGNPPAHHPSSTTQDRISSNRQYWAQLAQASEGRVTKHGWRAVGAGEMLVVGGDAGVGVNRAARMTRVGSASFLLSTSS